MLTILFWCSAVLGVISLTVSFVNALTAPRLTKVQRRFEPRTKVSVLIPARNEEHNIGHLIDDLFQQTYTNMEILILDDESQDNTRQVIAQHAARRKNQSQLHVLSGSPLPAGWLGKNWACQQLAKAATGDYLLFIDADVRLMPWALESSLKVFEKYNANVLSCFPTQTKRTVGEFFIVPLMNFFLLSFLPLWFVVGTNWNMFVAANGQFFLFQTDAYRRLGGHEANKGNVIEDMILAKRAKKMGLRLLTLIDDGCVSCRMYDGFWSAFNGFAKNFYAGFQFSAPLFWGVNGLYLITFLLPFVLVIFKIEFLVVMFLVVLVRILISWQSHQNIFLNIVLHPLQMLAMTTIAICSYYRTKFNKLSWKGRNLSF